MTTTTATLAEALRLMETRYVLSNPSDHAGPECVAARAALVAYDAERLKDAERRFEQALSDLRVLGCEPAMVGQSALAFRLYNVLQGVREDAGYHDAESPNYTETSGGGIDWAPGYFSGWMIGTYDLLEEFRGTLVIAD